MALKVKKFSETAKLPTVAHPGADLGFDVYADETVVLRSHGTAKVKTGIGVEMTGMATGFLVKDRSSMAIADLHVLGGVIDAGYRGEIAVIFANVGNLDYTINKGDKIAQMVPIPTLTRVPIEEVEELTDSSRGVQGFGSSDKPKSLLVKI
jgi:dUTP pyrophosphatase